MSNSLVEVRPDLAEEWSEKNYPLLPKNVSFGTHMKVWWVGKCGHEWQASVHSRTCVNQSGCPYCSGNRVLLGFNDLETRFPFVAAEWSDRNLPLTPNMVLAFSSQKVWWKGECGHEWFARIADRSQGHGCPYCTSHKLLKGFNDFASQYPVLASEWSPKNLPILPDMIPVNKSGIFWWKCNECGIEFRAWISSRIKNPNCPYCTGKIVIPGTNDLATTDPEIAAEWDYSRNKDSDPQHLHRTSKKIYWWISKYGYSWKAKVSDRTIDGKTCKPSGADFRRMLPQLLFMQYAKRKNFRVLFNSEALAGISIEILLPELKLAVEMESKKKLLTKEQTVKKKVCGSAGFDYYLLEQCKDAKEMANQVLDLFRKKHIYIDTDVNEDISAVQNAYLELMRIQNGRT